MSAGQFLAYLGRPHLEDPKEMQAWKLEGARLLARACELQGNDENVPHQCIVAAGILNKSGQHEANIRFLRRFLSVADDPEIRRSALGYLKRELDEQGIEARELRSKQLDEYRHQTLGFFGKDMALIVGPWFDPVGCVSGMAREQDCSSSWRAWSEQLGDAGLAP
jgi:hypothetical protein